MKMSNNAEEELTDEIAEIDINTEEVEYAYHVTNVPADNSCECENHPNWNKLKWHLADDPTYDGDLVGFPCVFFTTTLYNGGLPTQSMYPRNGKSDEYYWRVAVPLSNFNDHKILFCHKQGGQVRLVLAKGNVAERLTKNLKWQESDEYLRKSKQSNKITWRCQEYSANKVFVNFVVFDDVVIGKGCEWSKVLHKSQKGNPNRNKLKKKLISAMINFRPPTDESSDEEQAPSSPSTSNSDANATKPKK